MFKGKRILAFVLMVVMLLSLLPVFALAEEVSIEGRTNLLETGDFNYAEWKGSGWTVSSNTYGTKGTLSAEKYRGESGYSAKVGDEIKDGTTAGNKWISLSFDVGEDQLLKVGNTYRFVVYAMKGDADSNPKLEARGLNSAGKNAGSKTTEDYAVTSSTDWVMLHVDLTVPDTATKVTVYLRNNSATDGSYCYFDDCAVYDLSEKLYTVTWKNYDGTTLETDKNLAAGVTPEYNGVTPARPASGNYGYTFTGWSPEITAVTGDVTYTAQFACEKMIAADDFEGTNSLSWHGFSTKAEFSQDVKQSGSQSAKIIYGGTNSTSKWISHTLSVENGDLIPGHTYRFVAYSMMGDANSVPQIRVVAEHTTTKKFDSNTGSDGTTVGDEWVMLEKEYETPADVTKITIYLRNLSGTDGSYCYFDDFAVYDLSAEAPAEKFALKGATVDLGNSLDMNFYIDPANLDANETYNAKIVRSYADGTADEELTVAVDKTKVDTKNGNYIYVTYGNIAAKEMGDEIAVTICDSEGNAVSKTWTDSVKNYAERALVAYQNDAKTVAVLKDLLNYGAAAQAKFEYDVENPVDSDLSDIRDITVTGEATTNVAMMGTTLTLKSNILMEMFFYKDKVGEATTATVSYTNHRGTVVTEEVSLLEDNYYLNAYKVQIDGLVIADINTEVTVTIGDITVTDTMAWFVERSTDADIYSAILALGDSAHAYFH